MRDAAFSVAPQFGPGRFTTVADPTALSEQDLPDLRLEQDVKAYWPNGSVVGVSETVVAPTTLDLAKAFSAPAADLEKIATSPQLQWR